MKSSVYNPMGASGEPKLNLKGNRYLVEQKYERVPPQGDKSIFDVVNTLIGNGARRQSMGVDNPGLKMPK